MLSCWWCVRHPEHPAAVPGEKRLANALCIMLSLWTPSRCVSYRSPWFVASFAVSKTYQSLCRGARHCAVLCCAVLPSVRTLRFVCTFFLWLLSFLLHCDLRTLWQGFGDSCKSPEKWFLLFVCLFLARRWLLPPSRVRLVEPLVPFVFLLLVFKIHESSTCRCPLLAIPTAIMYAVQESHGPGAVLPRVAGCGVLLVAFVVGTRRLLPAFMRLLVLKDKEKVLRSTAFQRKGGEGKALNPWTFYFRIWRGSFFLIHTILHKNDTARITLPEFCSFFVVV